MLGASIRRNSLILALFALATAGLIALIFQSTQARIADAQYRAAQRALLEIVPRERHDNDMLADTIELDVDQQRALGLRTAASIHVARKNGEVVAFIVPATAPDGYSGDIQLIIGVNLDGSISGVRVLNHRETPGLGDKLELSKAPWILSFDGKSLGSPPASAWAVKKDGGEFDQFTGATITPRAVVGRVKATLEYLQNNRDTLLAAATQNEAPAP